MRTLFSLLLASIMLVQCSSGQDGQENPTGKAEEVLQETATITDLASPEFKKSMEEMPGQLVDVRSPEEFQAGHLAGAANINVNDDGFVANLAGLDKKKPVYVYCQAGGRSAKAARIMKEQGFLMIYNMSDGYGGWSGNGLPVQN